MKQLNPKIIGVMLISFSILLFFILIVVKINVDKEEAFLCSVVEQSPTLTMDQCPAHGSNSSWLLLAAFMIAFLVLGMGMYLLLLLVKRERQEESFTKIDSAQLPEEEKKIYDLIAGQQGSMYQSDVIKQTDTSKVKVSRILDRMEGKGILERKRRGMTNIIILK